MQRSGRLNRGIGLTALCILLLSVLNTTFAAPIARDEDGATALVARGDSNVYEVSYTDDNGKTTKTWYQHNSQIGKDEYKTYLNFNYKNKDKYILFTGGSEDQVQKFQAANPNGDWNYYKNFFVVPPSVKYAKYPHFSHLDNQGRTIWREDNSDAYSRAVAEVAEKQILVFGANDYTKRFPHSTYTLEEAPALREGVRDKRLDKITHMRKGATDPKQVMATEDGDGKFTYMRGYQSNTENSTKKCKRGGDCAAGQQEVDDTDNTKGGSTAPAGDSQPYGDTASQTTHAGDSTTAADSATAEGHSAGQGASSESHGTTTDIDPIDIHI